MDDEVRPFAWALAIAALTYVTAISPAFQQALGAATAIVRPIVLPLIELINVPAFVFARRC